MLQYANHWLYYHRWQYTYDDKIYRFVKDLILDKSNKHKTGHYIRLAQHEGGPSRKMGYIDKILINFFYMWPLVA